MKFAKTPTSAAKNGLRNLQPNSLGYAGAMQQVFQIQSAATVSTQIVHEDIQIGKDGYND